MASIELVLRYEGDEAKVEIPLSTDLPEVLRRVRLKKGCHSVEETAHQVADDIRSRVYDQRLIRVMLKEIVGRLDQRSG